jgi:hypothetical protein
MAAISKLRLLTGRKTADTPSAIAPADVAPADEGELPIPSDIKTVFLGGLFCLGVLTGCYVAAEIVFNR